MSEAIYTNARILLPDAMIDGTAVVRAGTITEVNEGRSSVPAIDFDGDYLMPGLVELHTDHLEGHYNPRPGVAWPAIPAVIAHDAQVAAAADKYPHVTVAEIFAPVDVLVERIVSRGRETAEQAMARVARRVPDFPMGIPVVRIVNDGSLDAAINQFCNLLERLEDALLHPAPHPDEDEREEAGDEDGGLAA